MRLHHGKALRQRLRPSGLRPHGEMLAHLFRPRLTLRSKDKKLHLHHLPKADKLCCRTTPTALGKEWPRFQMGLSLLERCRPPLSALFASERIGNQFFK